MSGPYVIPFGVANAGAQPTFTFWTNVDTQVEISPKPTISVVDAGGRAYFNVDWSTLGDVSIAWTATVPSGTEMIGVVDSPGVIRSAPQIIPSNVGIPTVASGVPEASSRLFSDFLIEAVKRRVRTPISQATLDVWEVFSICDEQTRSYVVPLMLQTGEDYMTARVDLTISGTVANYRPPTRSMRIREVQLLDTMGKEVDFPRIAIEELPYRTDGFYLLGNDVMLVAASRWDGFTLRLTYNLRPSRLVLSAEAGVVGSINRGTGSVTLYTSVTGLSGATTVDLVAGTPPFEVRATDVPCSVSGATVSITTPANIPATWGAAGDLVCLPQQTPAPQIHPDLWNLLVQAVAVDILDGNGDDVAFQRAASRLKKMETDAKLLLTPRVEGEPIPFGGHSPIWDRPWAWR